MMQDTLWPFCRLMRWDKPIGFWLLWWPVAWALLCASHGRPSWSITLVFLAGCWIMRSAGCVINDWADRRIDGKVERTQDRPLPAGTCTPAQAMGLFISLLLLAYALTWLLSARTQQLAYIGAVLTLIYPFAKRYMDLPQAVLGLAFAWGIPMAYTELTGSIPASAWLLLASAACLAIGYDTCYAMADYPDDARIGIRTPVTRWGQGIAWRLAYTALFINYVCLLSAAWLQNVHPSFYLILIGLALRHHQQMLRTRQGDPTTCFEVFLWHHRWGAGITLAWLVGFWIPPC